MTTVDVVRWLKLRADSYSSDARSLRDVGSSTEAIAYQTIATELRRCAEQLESTDA